MPIDNVAHDEIAPLPEAAVAAPEISPELQEQLRLLTEQATAQLGALVDALREAEAGLQGLPSAPEQPLPTTPPDGLPYVELPFVGLPGGEAPQTGGGLPAEATFLALAEPLLDPQPLPPSPVYAVDAPPGGDAPVLLAAVEVERMLASGASDDMTPGVPARTIEAPAAAVAIGAGTAVPLEVIALPEIQRYGAEGGTF